MMKLGFIGAGVMAESIFSSALRGGAVTPDCLMVSDVREEYLAALRSQYGILTSTDNAEVVAWADMLVLAVKPFVCDAVLDDLGDALSGKAVVSIMAGWDRDRLETAMPEDCRILRVMPNTPAMVGCGMTVLFTNHSLTPDEYGFAKRMFETCGQVAELEERLCNAVIGISGSGPAYVFEFINALANGGVQQGIPKAVALQLAVQTVLGAAEMVRQTGDHPSVLRDRVCTPGGTTIEAMYALDKAGFAGTVMEAVEVCAQKAAKV